MTLPIKICLIGSEPLYSKEYHLHKRENGKYRCILDKFYKKIIAVIFWEIIKRYFAQKIDEYRRKN